MIGGAGVLNHGVVEVHPVKKHAGAQDTLVPEGDWQSRGQVLPATTCYHPFLLIAMLRVMLDVLLPHREFVMGNFAEMKAANPHFPILVRECSGVDAKLVARYGTCVLLMCQSHWLKQAGDTVGNNNRPLAYWIAGVGNRMPSS